MLNRLNGVILIYFIFASSVLADGAGVVFSSPNPVELAKFYVKVLDFKAENSRCDVYGSDTARPISSCIRLQLGSENIYLKKDSEIESRAKPKYLASNDTRFQHIAIVVSEMDKAFAKLKINNVHLISPQPQTIPPWNKTAGGIKALYFADPDGHPLELIYFPIDKGLPKWQKHSGELFLGIDHTAIVVSDIEQSQKFYSSLGLKEVGNSENYGPEQEDLSGVQGAHIKIKSMRGSSGIGLEFLQYLRPEPVQSFHKGYLDKTEILLIVSDAVALRSIEASDSDSDGHRIIVSRQNRAPEK